MRIRDKSRQSLRIEGLLGVSEGHPGSDHGRSKEVLFVSPFYNVKEWLGTYETKLLFVPTHDLFTAKDIQPSGEGIKRSRKNKARAIGRKRDTRTPDLIDFSGMGSQALRRQDCQPTGARHGY